MPGVPTVEAAHRGDKFSFGILHYPSCTNAGNIKHTETGPLDNEQNYLDRGYPQFARKTVRRHKICVLLRCFRSMYARYMSFKSALYPAQILYLLTFRTQTKRIFSFSRQAKEAYRELR